MKKLIISLCLFSTALFAQANTERQELELDESNLYYATVMNSNAPQNAEKVTVEQINKARNRAFLEFFKTKKLTDTTEPYIKSLTEAGSYCVSGETKSQNTLYGCLKAVQAFNKTMQDFEPSPYKELYLDFETHPHTPSDKELEAARDIYTLHSNQPTEVAEHQASMFYAYNRIIGRILEGSPNSSPQKSKGVIEIYLYYFAEGVKVRNSQ